MPSGITRCLSAIWGLTTWEGRGRHSVRISAPVFGSNIQMKARLGDPNGCQTF